MFIGHIAVGLGSKSLAPKTSLGVLVAAPMFVDLVWPLLLLTGLEKVQVEPGNTAFTPLNFVSYPYTHSLAGSLICSVLFAAVYWLVSRYRRGTVVVFFGVLSHWVLDWITHRPDLPLYPGGTKVGLGLWDSIAGTLAVETALFAAGVLLYVKTTRPLDRVGRYGFAGFLALLVVLYLGNSLGPPPPGAEAVAWASLALWLLPVWCGWFDRHRTVSQ
jgi:membrane-bound metal-dependent hydrolase YbcI (DUF457 family)